MMAIRPPSLPHTYVEQHSSHTTEYGGWYILLPWRKTIFCPTIFPHGKGHIAVSSLVEIWEGKRDGMHINFLPSLIKRLAGDNSCLPGGPFPRHPYPPPNFLGMQTALGFSLPIPPPPFLFPTRASSSKFSLGYLTIKLAQIIFQTLFVKSRLSNAMQYQYFILNIDAILQVLVHSCMRFLQIVTLPRHSFDTLRRLVGTLSSPFSEAISNGDG